MKTTPQNFNGPTPATRPVFSVRKTSLSLVATLALGAFVPNALAVDYYWRSTDTSSTWNTSGKWFTSTTGGAPSPGMSSADTYIITNTGTNITNTVYDANIATDGTTTFLGGTLVLATGGQLNLRATGNKKAQIPNFVTTGGGLIASAGATGAVHNLIVDSFNNQSGVTALRLSSATNNRDLNLEIGTLVGAGGFAIDVDSQAGRTLFLSAANATGYTGSFDFNRGVINFNNNLVSGGSLILGGTAVVTLDQSVTFTSVIIGGESLGLGFHSFESLNAAFDVFFTDGGSGGITVAPIPEPAAWTTLAGAAFLAGAALRRRRRD